MRVKLLYEYSQFHKDSLHERRKPFKCTLCDSQFSRMGCLNLHIKIVHEKKKPLMSSVALP